MQLHSGECQRKPLMISHHWLRLWLGAIRQNAYLTDRLRYRICTGQSEITEITQLQLTTNIYDMAILFNTRYPIPNSFCAVSVWSAISKSPIFAITIFLVSIRPSLGNQIGASNSRVTVDIDGSYCFNKAPSRASEISLSNKAPLTHIYCPPPPPPQPPPHPQRKKNPKKQKTKIEMSLSQL